MYFSSIPTFQSGFSLAAPAQQLLLDLAQWKSFYNNVKAISKPYQAVQ